MNTRGRGKNLMASTTVNRLVASARLAALGHDRAGWTDAALLDTFIRTRDEAAFAALVRRHGSLVLGVCRRVLRNEADAEDAFQATFLILARKAASIRSPGAVANWLYGVAHTTAVKAQAMIRKRRTRERQAATMPKTQACEEVWQALQTLLDAELAALPDKYRTAVVLCALEGKTIRDAARELGWPHGTVASRLARGRALLARRLAKQGLVVSAGALAAALAHGTACAALPPTLVLATAQAGTLLAAGQAVTGPISTHVTALTQGVLQAMFLSKLKTGVAVVVVLAMFGAGTMSLSQPTSAAQDTAPAKQVQQPADAAKLRLEIERLRAELALTKAKLKVVAQELKALQAKANEDRAIAEAQRQAAQAAAVEARDRAELERRRAVAAAEQARQAELAAQQGNGDPKRKQDPPAPVATAGSPDGRIVVSAQGEAILAFDVKTGKLLFKSAVHKAPIRALAFSPDGKLLAGGAQDKAVLMWDSATGKLIRQFTASTPIGGIRFSDDGRTIRISAQNGQAVHEMDPASGKELRVIRKKPQEK
jgi:RNA polymerase sigma factor (sigma-70 family)